MKTCGYNEVASWPSAISVYVVSSSTYHFLSYLIYLYFFTNIGRYWTLYICH